VVKTEIVISDYSLDRLTKLFFESYERLARRWIPDGSHIVNAISDPLNPPIVFVRTAEIMDETPISGRQSGDCATDQDTGVERPWGFGEALYI
jgi:hypothetical protein